MGKRGYTNLQMKRQEEQGETKQTSLLIKNRLDYSRTTY
jgi:hypothetical protein